MATYHITGGHPLNGTMRIAGRKNAALKLLAATLLTTGTVTLSRVPDIGDVRAMVKILESMGAEIEHTEPETYKICTAHVKEAIIPELLGRKLRASLVLVGPLLARFGRATFPHPGGCVIGKRTIGPHLMALEELGAQIAFDGTTYTVTSQQLTGKEIYLKERSVTGTENIMMAACGAQGTTVILNAAEEPHIRNLADLLRDIGFDVSGDGTSTITIQGRTTPTTLDCSRRIIADDIEVGTFAVAAALAGGTVTLEEAGPKLDLWPILSKLDDFNVQYKYEEATEALTILPSPHLISDKKLQSNPWPGFPSDLQSPFTVLATQAEGTSLIQEWMYEGRLYFVDMLQRMGANITICDPHRVIVVGPTPLYHNSHITPDLRAGAALIVAALIAEGTTIIEHSELIERGYVNIDKRLAALGAEIVRVD